MDESVITESIFSSTPKEQILEGFFCYNQSFILTQLSDDDDGTPPTHVMIGNVSEYNYHYD